MTELEDHIINSLVRISRWAGNEDIRRAVKDLCDEANRVIAAESKRPEADAHLLKEHAEWASKFTEVYGYVPSSFDTWCVARDRTKMLGRLIGLPVIDPSLMEVGK